MPYIVLAGDPLEGFRVIGPFASLADAAAWNQKNVPMEIFGIEAELEHPDEVTWPD
jgi:hypothetical protein